MFASVVQVRQKGLAILECPCGKPAALRNLALATTLLKQNLVLLQLRLLQTLHESAGHSIVISPTAPIINADAHLAGNLRIHQ